MGGEYQQQMTDALASARMGDGKANTPITLHIRSGKPVNMFEAQAWAAAFVEFFYGDCAPNLARPRKVGLRELFHYLAIREELEYSLEADKDDPLIPGGCYRAPSQSRWNTPEFMAIFADVVRKLRIHSCFWLLAGLATSEYCFSLRFSVGGRIEFVDAAV